MSTWSEAAADARATLTSGWSPTTGGTRAAIAAMRATLDRLAEHARSWEEAGWPDIDAPADGATALRAIHSDAEDLRLRSLERFEAGAVDEAVELMRSALERLVHPDLLPAIAVACRRAQRWDDARASMRAALAIRPDDEPRRRLLAVFDGRMPPEEGDDVTADWLDPERRPTPAPEFMMDSR